MAEKTTINLYKYLLALSTIVLGLFVFLSAPQVSIASCSNNDQCNPQVCDTSSGQCVQCVANSDCGVGQICGQGNSCMADNSGKCALRSLPCAYGCDSASGACYDQHGVLGAAPNSPGGSASPGVAGATCDPSKSNSCQAGLTCKIDPVTTQATCGLPDGPSVGGNGAGADCSSAVCDMGYTCDPATKKCIANATPTIPGQITSMLNCPDGMEFSNGTCIPKSTCTGGICASTSLSDLIIKVINYLLTFAGLIAVLMVIIGGYWYMAAGGNEEQAEKGKKTLFGFVLGFALIILAYAIVNIVANTLTGGDKLVK